jgi:hypothetical protein
VFIFSRNLSFRFLSARLPDSKGGPEPVFLRGNGHVRRQGQRIGTALGWVSGRLETERELPAPERQRSVPERECFGSEQECFESEQECSESERD